MGYESARIPGVLLSSKIRMSNSDMVDGKLYKKISDTIIKAKASYYKNKSIDIMHPVYDNDGRIIDFRYTSKREDRIVSQELKTSGSEILAKTQGSIGSVALTNINNEELLNKIWKDEELYNNSGKMGKDNSHLYFKIKSKDIKMSENDRRLMYESGSQDLIDLGRYGIKTRGEEMWGMLTPDTKKNIIEHNIEEDIKQLDIDIEDSRSESYKIANGIDGRKRRSYSEQKQDIEDFPRREVIIRKDLINQLFGYQEASITDLKIFSKFKQSTKYKVEVAESYVKDASSILKSNVVVKLPSTIFANIVSNARFLFYAGMPIKKAFSYLLASTKHLNQWKKDDFEREQIKRKMNGETGARLKKLERDYSDMEAQIKNNPLYILLEHGLYQSVVEDVVLHEENNRLSKAIGKFGPDKNTSPNLHEAVHTVFLTNESMAGKALTRITQESDFPF